MLSAKEAKLKTLRSNIRFGEIITDTISDKVVSKLFEAEELIEDGADHGVFAIKLCSINDLEYDEYEEFRDILQNNYGYMVFVQADFIWIKWN